MLSYILGDNETCKMRLKYGQRAMREWQDHADFGGSSIAPTLSALLADASCKLQIASNPACFLEDDNPLLLHASYLGNFNVSTAEHADNGFWHIWSALVLDDEIPYGFASIDDHPDGILVNYRFNTFFKVRIYTRQLKAFLEQVGHSAPQSDQDLLTALRLWEQTACAMVATALADGEGANKQMQYDAVWVYFRRINEFGRKILQSLVRQSASVTAFPIDCAVGTPLFFCGFYCRDWSARREALRLLRASEERFKGSNAAAFLPMKISALERIIDVESHALQAGYVVPESARIRYVEFTGRPGSSNIRFSYRPVGMDGLVEIL